MQTNKLNKLYRLNIMRDKDIDNNMLQNFIRYQETKEVYLLEKDQLVLQKSFFIDDWDMIRKQEICEYLRQTVKNGGKVITISFKDNVIAFANIEPKIYYNQYIVMPFIHVSKNFRGQGLGSILFDAIVKEASKMGAKKLYIASHPSKESQLFYKKNKCVLATTIIPTIYESEPLDIQLERKLNV